MTSRIGSVLAVLCLSANTSFVGFPRLCRLLARDRYLPYFFAMPGRRLVYSLGILFLATAAGILLVAFGGITDRLIPLFAVGAFLSFTLSQAGMAMHWTRDSSVWAPGRARHGVQLKRFVNGLGAVATGIALVIIILAKFVEGAWITILVIPLLFWLMQTIRHRLTRCGASCAMARCATWRITITGGDAAHADLECHRRQGAALRHEPFGGGAGGASVGAGRARGR